MTPGQFEKSSCGLCERPVTGVHYLWDKLTGREAVIWYHDDEEQCFTDISYAHTENITQGEMALMTNEHTLEVVNRTLSATVQKLMEHVTVADARIARLEAALEEIAACKMYTDRAYIIDIARAALEPSNG